MQTHLFIRNTNNYKYYLLGSLLLYTPLITFNILMYSTIKDINNILNTPENIHYVQEIKVLINDICKVINCSTSV